ncbi:MAG: DUF4430 domain-containing protein [Eubacterium sp.]|nr:DUF4430 domain-containing protein [Eubacterium sp.]
MKNKMIIAIITALIGICAIVGAVQHFGNDKEENSNLISAEVSAKQTTDEKEVELSAVSEGTPNTPTSSEAKSESNSQTKSTAIQTTASQAAGTTAKKAETTKQQTSTVPNTTKTQTTVKTTEKQNITVTVSINCKTALKYGADVPQSGYFYSPAKQTAANGATAFDVLEKVCKSNGISLTYQQKTYIQAIGGLAEKDCGGASGWTYKVNGIKPPKAASKYVLSDGDIVEWYYVTSPND